MMQGISSARASSSRAAAGGSRAPVTRGVGADRLVDRRESGWKIPGRSCGDGIRTGGVQRLSYEVPGWGMGELWFDGGGFSTTSCRPPGELRAEARQHPLAERVRRSSPASASPSTMSRSTSRGAPPFQLGWRASCGRCPYGETVTYGELAALAGHPNAQRAAGTFCAGNRFPLFVPVPPRGLGRTASAATDRSASSTSAAFSSSSMLSEDVRAELAGIDPRKACCRLAELSALVRTAGSVHFRGGGRISLHLEVASPAVARRAFSLLRVATTCRGEIRTFKSQAFEHATRFQIHLDDDARALQVLNEAGILDSRLAPLERPPARVVGRSCCRAAYLRGALLASGSVSGPRNAHLELRSANVEGAELLAALAEAEGFGSPSTTAAGTRSPTRSRRRRSPSCSRSSAPTRRPSGSRRARSSPRRARGPTGSPTPTTRTSSARAGPRRRSSALSAASRPTAGSSISRPSCARSPSSARATRRCRCASSRAACGRPRRRRPRTGGSPSCRSCRALTLSGNSRRGRRGLPGRLPVQLDRSGSVLVGCLDPDPGRQHGPECGSTAEGEHVLGSSPPAPPLESPAPGESDGRV